MKIRDIADETGLSQKTIRRHIHAKALKAVKGSGSYEINETDMNEWFSNYEKNNKRINSSKIIGKVKGSKGTEGKFVSIEQSFKKDFWLKPNKKGYKFADFFAGAGGISTGLIKSGMRPIYSIEIMPQATRTYNYNIASKFGDEILDTRDITDDAVRADAIKFLKKNKVDIITGGFPCQGFSLSGSRVVDDPRNSLYIPMLEIVKAVKPKVVIMENVQGLRSMLDGNVERKIVSDYKKAGYNISVETLNSADYGVPQQRKRVFLIANRIGKQNLYPAPIKSKENYISVETAIKDLVSSKENIDFNHEFTKHRKDMITRIGDVEEGKSLYKGYSDAWKKVVWDKPSPTVKENHGGVFLHPKVNRVMTPRELARLQSFPDDFIFKGSKKWQLVQIGNAVPPLMSKAIGLAITKMLKSD